MMMPRSLRALAGLGAITGAATMWLPTLAFAHHPMGGMMPTTFAQGFLSGIGHPVLGPDHLAFVVGIGLLVGLSERWFWLPAAFVATLIPGVLVHGAGFGVGPNELIVALSLAVLGLAVLGENRLPTSLVVAAVLASGFFHGYAFGETIVGAETGPVVAYLLGLSVMIALMTTAVAWCARWAISRGASSVAVSRVASTLLVVGGLALVLQGAAS